MPKTNARLRAVKKDAVLEAAVDVARAGAEAVAHPRPVGEHVGFEFREGSRPLAGRAQPGREALVRVGARPEVRASPA